MVERIRLSDETKKIGVLRMAERVGFGLSQTLWIL